MNNEIKVENWEELLQKMIMVGHVENAINYMKLVLAQQREEAYKEAFNLEKFDKMLDKVRVEAKQETKEEIISKIEGMEIKNLQVMFQKFPDLIIRGEGYNQAIEELIAKIK